MAPGWTSIGSVEEASEGAFALGAGLGLPRELRVVFRFDAGGLLRGAMNGSGR
jgi:hypothetical protein